jgi:hypothetical protein
MSDTMIAGEGACPASDSLPASTDGATVLDFHAR